MTGPRQGICTECGTTGPLRHRDLCPTCYQRHWRAGTLPKLPPAPRAPRVTRDCEHPGRPHQHGTRSAYVLDRCRCEDCTTANREGHRQRSRRKAVDQWNPDASQFVDGDIVRDHLRQLMASGMGWKRIASVASVGYSTVYPILYGKHRDDPLHPEHRPPRKQVSRVVAGKLLAVEVDLAGGALVEGVGTTRRLQALVAAGWSQSRLATPLGVTVQDINTLVHNHHEQVTRSTADRVAALYERCWRGPQPAASRFEQSGITRARNTATRYGWAPPMAWDDDTIDDPTARPDVGEQVSIQQARAENIRELLAIGEHPDAILGRLSLSRATFERWALRSAPDLIGLMAEARTREGERGHVRTGAKRSGRAA